MNQSLRVLLIFTFWTQIGCDDFFPKDNDPLTESNVFILCEGNFGQLNASLWMVNPESQLVSGPIYQNLKGTPLGDIGQSMALENELLYVVNNTSHSIEIFDLSGGQAVHTHKIDVQGTSPRYIAINGDRGYFTSWNEKAILVINLQSQTIDKKIQLDGMPEDILIHNNHLYVSMIMKPDWSSDNRILKLSMDGDLISTYAVIDGPGRMIIHKNKLYIASLYFDSSWNTFSGNSQIDLNTEKIITTNLGMSENYGSDILVFNDKIYRSYKGGVAPLNSDLTVQTTVTIGNVGSAYSAAAFGEYIFLGQTDYTAPDTVFVYNKNNIILQEYEVGAIPGEFILFKKEID